MVRIVATVVCCLLLSSPAWATNYYVDAVNGSDQNNGQSTSTAWQSITKVNSTTFQAGDRICFKRGDIWRETLNVPSSGESGNPVTFCSYGTGDPPLIRGTATGLDWSQYKTNIWVASVEAPVVPYCLFDGIAGNAKKKSSQMSQAGDFVFVSGTLGVYSPSDPSLFYQSVEPAILAECIRVSGKQNVTIEGIKCERYYTNGILIDNGSQNITIDSCDFTASYPFDDWLFTTGVYIDGSSGVNIYNSDVSMNTAGIVSLGNNKLVENRVENTRVYANYMYGIYDPYHTITYSTSHIYANGVPYVPLGSSMDVSGALDGGGNISGDTKPTSFVPQRYPALMGFGIDDIGITGTDLFADEVIDEFGQRGERISLGVFCGKIANTNQYFESKLSEWYTAGQDICAHSWSHQYFDQPFVMGIQYVGSGSSCTLSISDNMLTTAVTGGASGENLQIDLTSEDFDTLYKLRSYIDALPAYSARQLGEYHLHTKTFSNVTMQDIKTREFAISIDKERFVRDELVSSKTYLENNITGLTVKTYVWPGNRADEDMKSWLLEEGYLGGRAGQLYTLESGVEVASIDNYSVAPLVGESNQEIQNAIARLAFFSAMWGRPAGLYCHETDGLSATEIGYIADAMLAEGTYMTYTEMIEWLRNQTEVLPGRYARGASD